MYVLIGLIRDALKDRPRRDLVRETVHLRQAIEQCQSSYETYKADPSIGTSQWDNALGVLEERLANLSKLLHIFDPAAGDTIDNYRDFDRLEYRRFVGKRAAGRVVSKLGGEAGFPSDTIKSALSELDRFIRTTFKPEEVKAALDKG